TAAPTRAAATAAAIRAAATARAPTPAPARPSTTAGRAARSPGAAGPRASPPSPACWRRWASCWREDGGEAGRADLAGPPRPAAVAAAQLLHARGSRHARGLGDRARADRPG